MDESKLMNQQAVLLYIDGAREALHTARFNLDNGFYGATINRAYYSIFYAATALLLTLDLTRSKHSGVLAAFRENFVKPGIFSVEDSRGYGEAFELRNVTDYETLGKAEEVQARTTVENASRFFEQCKVYLSMKGYQ